ncbi:hypothetical protein GE21DRAFT_8716 [Neurospora crassa]|uniref:Uncharacterized protein n=2 Tax=Neurospora crassa TaxID=5141 RepID=Q7S6A7_NEUCR|nr:hypothetical protein NCU04746 [Neurospora crassa OR74A]EAA31043.1 hypothetical protein NCU04746 [Neurospora crassa OR74A]KHE88936.1 hypothetical protein GE21DRAFT_8716 [Neurospora crassa]CAF06132.1 hypothetical protein H4H7.200 [Neurospora crassa]|eukprot:XP_960279.1 hypothetical protein NCU04746 [Neurospora crassa OR74A]
MSVETACEHTHLVHSSEGEASGDGPAALTRRIGGWVLYVTAQGTPASPLLTHGNVSVRLPSVTARSTAFGKEIRPISKQKRSGVKPFSMIPDILGTRPAGMVYLSSQFPVPGVKHEVTLKMGARLTTTDGTIPNAKHSASGNSLRDIEDERHSNRRTDEVITNGYSMILFLLLTVASKGLLQIFICWGPRRDPASPRQSGISFVNGSDDEKQRTRKEGF